MKKKAKTALAAGKRERVRRRCCSLPGLQVLRTQKMYGIAG